jgi:hypothetical protein
VLATASRLVFQRLMKISWIKTIFREGCLVGSRDFPIGVDEVSSFSMLVEEGKDILSIKGLIEQECFGVSFKAQQSEGAKDRCPLANARCPKDSET